MFFDKKCTIYWVVLSSVRGVETKTKTAIYTNIDCNFEIRTKKDLSNSNIARESNIQTYDVALPINNSLVRQWQAIELIEPVIGSIWTFVIDNVLVNQSLSWQADNLLLQVSRRNDS